MHIFTERYKDTHRYMKIQSRGRSMVLDTGDAATVTDIDSREQDVCTFMYIYYKCIHTHKDSYRHKKKHKELAIDIGDAAMVPDPALREQDVHTCMKINVKIEIHIKIHTNT